MDHYSPLNFSAVNFSSIPVVDSDSLGVAQIKAPATDYAKRMEEELRAKQLLEELQKEFDEEEELESEQAIFEEQRRQRAKEEEQRRKAEEEKKQKAEEERKNKEKTTNPKRLTPKKTSDTNVWDIYRPEFLQKVEFDPSTKTQQEAVLNEFNKICEEAIEGEDEQVEKVKTMLGAAKRIIFVDSTKGVHFGLVSYYDSTRNTLQISSNFDRNKIYLSPQSLRENAYMADSIEKEQVPTESFLQKCESGLRTLLAESQKCLTGLKKSCSEIYKLSKPYGAIQTGALEDMRPPEVAQALRETPVGKKATTVANSVVYDIEKVTQREGTVKPHSMMTKNGSKELTQPQKELANFKAATEKANQRMQDGKEAAERTGDPDSGALFRGLGPARLDKATREKVCGSSTIPTQAAQVSGMFQGRQ